MKPDKSPQGFYDEDILPLLRIINKKYRTTSSCSGRITLMKGLKKGEAEWLYKTHKKASAQKIFSVVQEHGQLRFLYEPLIIHLQCKDQEQADALLQSLQSNGFKKASCISFKNYTLEIKETGKMETILTKELSKPYIKLLVQEANLRLKKTKKHIKDLERLFSKRERS